LLQRASQVTDTIEGLIAKEAAALIAHDSRKFPVPASNFSCHSACFASVEAISAAIEARAASKNRSSNCLENYEDDEQDPFQEEQRMIAAFDTVQTSLFDTAERGNKMYGKRPVHS
jgi:pre-mRNA-splicing factor CDC5/CEF1